MKIFLVIIPILFLFSCGNKNNDNQVVNAHPALSNPLVKPYTDAIASDSTNAELYFQRAEKLFDLKMEELTENDLATAVRLAPENMNYKVALSAILIDRGKGSAALEQIKALQKMSNQSDYVLMEAEAYMADQKVPEAEKIINNLLAQNPNDPKVLLDASKLKAIAKDTTTAIEYAKKIAEIAPTFYDGVYQLADLYNATNNKEAVNWYLNIYKLDTLNAYPLYDLSRYYHKQGDLIQTKHYLSKAIAVDKSFANAYNDYGTILMQEDSLEKAARLFQMAIENAPANADAYYGKGMTYLKKGNKELAKKFFIQALTFNGKHENAKKEYEKLK
ncbi:MAG TPA: tetratricopeptide repeat protein [Edaphocola sp.]|nr:tetratricopeptide repeat protein [Edaphocola sp.]